MPKPNLAAIAPYRVATPPHRIKLNQNESPFEVPPPVRRRILARMRKASWRRYPPFPADDLRGRLAELLRVPRSGVLVGNGSNEMLLSAVLATVRPKSRVVVARPGYPVFERFATLADARVRAVPLDADLAFRTDALAREAGRPGTALVLLASPNNPTGSALSSADAGRIAGATDALVVLDEAYHEFSRHDYRPLLRRHPNLVITRTFSKAFALAGMRLGYALGAPDVITALEAATSPFSLDLFSQIAGEEILDHADVFEARARSTVAERDRVAAALAGRPRTRVFPSEANFLLVRFAGAARTWRALLRRGILVRDVSAQPGLEDCLRITIGTRRENDAVVAALGEIRP